MEKSWVKATLLPIPRARPSPSRTSCWGIFDRERPQHNGVEQAENCSVRSDAKHERSERNDREGWAPEQGAGAIGHVAEEAFQTCPPPAHDAFLLDVGGVAEFDMCCAGGVGRGQAVVDLLLAAKLQMEADFFIELATELVATEEHLDAPFDFAGHAHAISPVLQRSLLRRCDHALYGAHDALEFTKLNG